MRLTNLIVKNTKNKGRGVFTNDRINENEIIEVCPIIKIKAIHKIEIDKTELYNYYFLWDHQTFAIALGYGSLYNHSNDPNTSYHFQYENDMIVFKTLKQIEPNQEVEIDYTNGTKKVWW